MSNPLTTIDYLFTHGLQTSTDPKMQLQGELLQLENATFDHDGAINKRNGFDMLSNAYNGGTISTGVALATIPGVSDELAMFDGTYLYGFSEAADSWIRKGKARSPIATNYKVVQNNDQQTSPDVAYAAGVECHVWADSRGGVYYKIIDNVTRTVIVPDTQLNANGVFPKVFAIGSMFVALYADSANHIKYHTVNTQGAANGFGNSASFCSDLHATNQVFDAVITGSKLFVAYNSNAASIKIRSIDNSLTISSAYNQASITADNTIAVLTDATQNIWVVAATATVAKAFVVSYNLIQQLANTTIETINNIYRITGNVSGSTATLYYEVNASLTYNQIIKTNTLTFAGAVGSPSVYRRSVGLAAKAFTYGSDVFIPVAYQSTYQSTFFILDANGEVVSKHNAGNGGGLGNAKTLGNVVAATSGTFLFANTLKSRSNSDSGIFYSLLGINLTSIDFAAHNSFLHASLSGSMLTVGGIVGCFDGSNMVEQNFHLFPENMTAAQSNTADGYLSSTAKYFYKSVFLWYDNNGFPVRSTPSTAVTVQMTGANDTVVMTHPTLRITSKSRVIIELYRTTNAGTIYYKSSSTALPDYNDTTVDTINITDILSDAELTSNEPLYTTGEIYNSAPPGCSVMCEWKNRIWQDNSDDPNVLCFTKRGTNGFPPNYNDTYTVRLTPHGGPIKDLSVLGDNLIIFKERAIYMLVGQGPLNTGAQSDYQAPILLTSEVGATVSGCVAEIPTGLMFVSHKGIYLISHQGAPNFIGLPVDGLFEDRSFVSAISAPLAHKVIFATSDGTWLVYDHSFDRWGSWTGLPAADAIIWNNKVVYLKSSGAALEQSDSSFLDNGSAVRELASTGWITPRGQQGYFQLHKVSVIGDYKSAHNLVVEIYRDYSSRKVTYTIDAAGTLNLSDYGEGDYGEDPFGGVTPRYQFALKPNMKCQSFRIVIYDTNIVGESMSLSGFRFEFAGLTGANRLPAKNKR